MTDEILTVEDMRRTYKFFDKQPMSINPLPTKEFLIEFDKWLGILFKCDCNKQ